MGQYFDQEPIKNSLRLREPQSKLEKILIEKNITQADLIRMVKDKSGFEFGRDRISRICTGKTKTYNLLTAVMIAEALEVKVDDIIEIKDIKKENKKSATIRNT